MEKYPLKLRRLKIYMDRPFLHRGADLRRAITATFPDRPILHNHLGNRFDYRSPRVRYLVIDKQPQLISFDEGLEILEEIYRYGTILHVGTRIYHILGTELEDQTVYLGLGDSLMEYHSITPWLGLNERNYDRYMRIKTNNRKKELISSILNGNYLSLCKSVGFRLQKRLMTHVLHTRSVPIEHRMTKLLGLKVYFVSNMMIPPGIGLGKLVSKGFGIMRCC